MTNTSSWQDMRRVIRESIGLIGFWMTLRYLLIYLLSYKPYNDHSFDYRHGTDTSGMVPTQDLDIADETTKWQSNLYLGSPNPAGRALTSPRLDQAPSIPGTQFDCGFARLPAHLRLLLQRCLF